jgi:hypothetical protein
MYMSDPLTGPSAVGRKLMRSVQIPGASVAGDEPPPEPGGHVEALLNWKPAEMLGTGSANGALPMFWTNRVCGLSELAVPIVALAKLRLGGVVKRSSFMPKPVGP